MESCLLLLGWAHLGALNEIHLTEHFPGCNSQGGVVGLFLSSSISHHSKIGQHVSPRHSWIIGDLSGENLVWIGETASIPLWKGWLSFLEIWTNLAVIQKSWQPRVETRMQRWSLAHFSYIVLLRCSLFFFFFFLSRVYHLNSTTIAA